MVLVVGLIVARPLVYGGDPGLTDPQNNPAGLVITLFWLLAAAVWCVWRVWARQDDYFVGLVEAGLGAVVLLVFATTYGVAAYQHPARLISWEWLAMLLALFLVRQLSVPVEEQHGMLAALLATAVSLSAFGLYEAFEVMPRNRAAMPTVEAMRTNPDVLKAGTFAGLDKDDPKVLMHFNRLHQPNIMGTFAHPNSFAGYLVLMLPALAGAAFLTVRGIYPNWQKVLACLCALVGAVALWQTHSRGALLAIGVVGLVMAAVVFRRVVLAHRVATAVTAAVLIVAAIVLSQSGLANTLLGKQQSTAAARTEYWKGTWQMIQERPWFGFGPGNFQNTYERFMSETAGEEIADPHNFALEMWATSGIFALLALLTALTAFGVIMGRRAWSTPLEEPAPPPPPLSSDAELPPVRWTFYLGGIFGLLLGFMLRASYTEPDKIAGEAIQAGVQSVIWFGSFALFEQIRWSPHARALVLTGGVAALLINLLVSGGISNPQLATMMWVVIALALNALAPTATPWLTAQRGVWLRYALVPVLAVAAGFYFLAVMVPVTNAKQALKVADVKKLEAALAEDPDNAEIHAVLARIYGSGWAAAIQLHRSEKDQEDVRTKALQHVEMARKLNPQGKNGYMAEFEFRLGVARAYRIVETNAYITAEDKKHRAMVRPDAVRFALAGAAAALERDPQSWGVFSWSSVRVQIANGAFPMAVGSPLAAVLNDQDKWREYAFDLSPQPDLSKGMAIGSMARAVPSNFDKYREENRRAAVILLAFLPNYPNDTQLHFDIAEALYRAEDWKEGNEHARRALDLDRIARDILANDEFGPILRRKLIGKQQNYLEQRLLFTPDN